MRNPKTLMRGGVVGTVLLHADSGHPAWADRLVRANRVSRLRAIARARRVYRLDPLCHLAQRQKRCVSCTG